MNKWLIITLLVIGVGLLIGSVLLRVYSGGKYEVKTIDLIFIIVPLLFVGLATGKLKGLDLLGVKADLSDLWSSAAETQIEEQISSTPVSPVDDVVEMIQPRTKGGVSEIPRLIEQKTEALAFRLGMGGYFGPAIEKYFNDLYGSSYLRYVVINNSDGSLYGIYPAADLIAYLRTLNERGYATFERMLNQGNEEARQWLARVPGFISVDNAVNATTSKRSALQVMEDLKLDSLPVVDESGRFTGTVERARLTTSLILSVTRKISDE